MDFQKTELFHPSRENSISSDIVPFFFFKIYTTKT